MGHFETFTQLHQQAVPLVLGNVWDISSARLFEKAGYKAIGTSSQAFAQANGYEDGEQAPFELLFQFAKRVTEVISIPFSVDLEGGYSRNVSGILEHISRLHDVGVAGINLEDTVQGATRMLLPATQFTQVLTEITDYISRHHLKIFINVRTDGFLLGLPNALEETLTRIKSYADTGINGIFTPCITAPNDIQQVVESTRLPVNVMCMPELPDFAQLTLLGVKRISMGSFLFHKAYAAALATAQTIQQEGSAQSLFH